MKRVLAKKHSSTRRIEITVGQLRLYVLNCDVFKRATMPVLLLARWLK